MDVSIKLDEDTARKFLNALDRVNKEEITVTQKQVATKLADALRQATTEMSVEKLGPMTDITAPEAVQIQIRPDGKVIWVNVNGICVLRCCRIHNLEVEGALWNASLT